MANCRKCKTPLNKGNVKVIRKPGKRAYRIHRSCPNQAHSVAIRKMRRKVTRKVILNDVEGKSTILSEEVIVSEGMGDVLLWPQEGTGGPLQSESEPMCSEEVQAPKFRFFVHPASVEKLNRAIQKGDAWFWGFASNWSAAITIEIIPVLDEIAEMNPEAVAHYVEVEFKSPDN